MNAHLHNLSFREGEKPQAMGWMPAAQISLPQGEGTSGGAMNAHLLNLSFREGEEAQAMGWMPAAQISLSLRERAGVRGNRSLRETL
jgi:hypothetical protein